jgi:hypothetical protein
MVIRAEDAPAEPACEATGAEGASCGYGGGASYRYQYVRLLPAGYSTQIRIANSDNVQYTVSHVLASLFADQ